MAYDLHRPEHGVPTPEMIRVILICIALLALAAVGSFWFVCPCATVAGGPLSGEEIQNPVSDWSFVNSSGDVPLCQVEVKTLVPYSVNVNCMSTAGMLYISCSNCDGKFWSSKALTIPAGRVRAGESVYPVLFSRVLDEGELDAAWRARAAKVGSTEVRQRPDHWWTFRLTSR